jgi:hypothetical protein
MTSISLTGLQREVLHFINRGQNVIYSDVDTIWFKDPRPFCMGDYDMWGTVDNESPID